jgi:hypothetical protein
MCLECNIEACWRNHCSSGNATMLAACIVELHVNIKNIRMLLWRIYVAGNNKTYLCLEVKCPIFLFSFNQIWSFSTDSYGNFHRILSSGSHVDARGRTDGYDEADRRFRDYANASKKALVL